MNCGGGLDSIKAATTRKALSFFDQLEGIASKLRSYLLLIKDRRIEGLVKAFEMFVKVKMDVCGKHNVNTCVDEYAVLYNHQTLINKILADVGIVDFSDGRNVIDALTKLNNVIVDIGICDLLQDEKFSRLVGYNHDTYCDENGLSKYRLIGAGAVGRSIERTDTGSVDYWYDSFGPHDRDFGVMLFLDNQAPAK